MKHLTIGSLVLLIVGASTIGARALAQEISITDTGVMQDAKTRAPFARLVVTPRSLAFGVVKAITTKSFKVKNSGTMTANLTVVPPTTSTPFSVRWMLAVLMPLGLLTVNVSLFVSWKKPVPSG